MRVVLMNNNANYGTHSVKSGEASNPACKSISADLLDILPAGNVPFQKTDTLNTLRLIS